MYKRHAVVETSLGEITIVAHDDSVVGIYFPHHWYPPQEGTLGERVKACDDHLLETAESQLDEYLAGERTGFDVATATNGDVVQERVWALLNDIPYGQTTTYGALAERLGDRSLAQVVGGAVGRNPLSVLVPCHRVLGKNGKLTGYAGGLRRKQLLLTLEAEHSAQPGFAGPRSG